MGAYLLDYESQLSSVVAEERLFQRDAAPRSRHCNAAPDAERRLISEVAFISLPGDAGWLGFRRE